MFSTVDDIGRTVRRHIRLGVGLLGIHRSKIRQYRAIVRRHRRPYSPQRPKRSPFSRDMANEACFMPSPMPRPIASLLTEARRVLGVPSQGALGELLGSSKHTGQRWETGRSEPMAKQLHELARRVYPRDADLARQRLPRRETATRDPRHRPASRASPRASAAPAAPSPPAEDVVDAVESVPRRSGGDERDAEGRDGLALLAAFTARGGFGLSLETMEQALAGIVALAGAGREERCGDDGVRRPWRGTSDEATFAFELNTVEAIGAATHRSHAGIGRDPDSASNHRPLAWAEKP